MLLDEAIGTGARRNPGEFRNIATSLMSASVSEEAGSLFYIGRSRRRGILPRRLRADRGHFESC